MDFFNRLFGNRSSQPDQPEMQFGRYSDAYKPKDRYEAWDESLVLFEKGEYVESFRKFFYYLTDEKKNNILYKTADDKIAFIIYQGSKQISGFINRQEVKAEAKIAKTNGLNIGFLRRMMEQNFSLKYSRFALDDEDNITIVFNSLLLDGSPYKLYYALKEVAVNADKLDDILIREFEVLDTINTSHTEALPIEEKAIKIRYLRSWTSKAFAYIDSGKLNKEQYPGGIAYVLLDLMFKIDYLIVPEGPTMETLERMHRVYFSNQNVSLLQKVRDLREGISKIMDKSDEALMNELYLVISTFGLASPVDHNQVKTFIEGELGNMEWYIDNKHHEVALAIPGYIVGFGMFNYALPLPVKFLFRLYYQIMEDDFFRELGYTFAFNNEDGTISKRAVKREMDRLLGGFRDEYPGLKVDAGKLVYTDKVAFAGSYLSMIHDLNFTAASRS